MNGRVLTGLVLLGAFLGGTRAQTAQALPAGEYAWTIEMRCETEALCKAAFGQPIFPSWWESYSFVGHISSDGRRMTYYGSNIYRGRPSAGTAGGCDSPYDKPFSGVCVLGEKGEAFLRASGLPALKGRLAVWAKNALLYSPRPGGQNAVIPCPCGPEGQETPTPAAVGTLTTKDFFGGSEPKGVTMAVQLVKLP